MDGLFFGTLMATVPWLVILAPLTGAVYYARRRHQRLRTLIVLAPSALVFVLIVCPLLMTPPTAANRFRQLTEHALPASARDVRMYDAGGGFDGVETTFFLRCTAEDTDGLIHVLGLQPSNAGDQPPFDNLPDATWPSPQLWEGRTFYSKQRVFVETGPRLDDLNFYLCTDATRTRVWLTINPH